MNQTSKLLSAIVFLVLWLCIASTPSIAQGVQNLKFKHYSIEQGLSQTTANDIIQDQEGYIWVATQEGLNRFDGYSFKIFKHNPADSTTIGNSFVYCIYQDIQTRLWAGTLGGGLSLYHPQTETFTHFQQDTRTPQSLSNNFVYAIYKDSKSRLWIGTDMGLNLMKEDGKGFEHFMNEPGNALSLSDNRVRTIYEDQEGKLWIGTLGGLNLLQEDSHSFTRFVHDPSEPRSLHHNEVFKILEDKQHRFWVATRGGGLNLLDRKTGWFTYFIGNDKDLYSLSNNEVRDIADAQNGKLWLGTAQGLCILDTETNRFTRYYHNPADPSSLSSNYILKIIRDHSGNFWIGTFGTGINFFDASTEVFSQYSHDKENPISLSENLTWGIYQDKQDRIWVSTDNGLNLLEPAKSSFSHFFNDPGNEQSLSHNRVFNIYQDNKNRVWIASRNGLNLYDEKKKTFRHFFHNPDDSTSISGNYVYSIFQDTENKIWVGTRESGLNYFNPDTEKFTRYLYNERDPESISNDRIQYIFQDKQSRLWIGTRNGLCLYHPQNGKFTRYQHDNSNAHSLSHNNVYQIFQDSHGRLWVATGGGLNLFNPDLETFAFWNESNGLSNNKIYGILEDGRGNLWMSTNQGINKFNPETEKFTWYDKEDGLQDTDFNQWSLMKDRNGYMYFGGSNGLSIFHPDSIQDNTFIPPVVITGFQLFNKPVAISDTTVLKKSLAYTQEIILTHQENVFAFEFSALNYRQPEKNQFAYKLEPFNKDWIYTDYKDRKAVFTNIPSGEYVFRVKASNDDGYWNEEGASINVIILPPWWLTWWAKIIWAGVIIGIPFTFYKIRTSTLKAQRKKLQVQVAEQTSELQKRLQEKKILYELSSHLIGRLGLDEVLKNIIDAAITIAPNAQGSSIFLLNQEENVLEGKISHRLPADQFQKVKFKVGEGLGGRAVAENRSFIENYVQDDKLFTQQLENDNITPLKSIIVVLLKNKDKTIGTISLDNYENHGAFTQTDFTMLSSLAANASLAIERVRMAKEIEDQNENLSKAYTQLKELDQYKESMTAMIVHDFKNSLNTVISFSEGTPTERRLKSIRQAGQFMLNMVMNILDLQKFESASVKMSLANYTVDTLISEAVEQLSYLIEQKAIKLTCKPTGQLYCRMDHDLTVRVIVNILSNAIKYVPQNGKIDIVVTRQNDFVRIAIRDNGIGIPADKIHSVFEKYVQINAQKSGSVRSTGIGLTFCKMVVESLGGNIGAESEEGKGSTFYFTLPFVNEDLSQALPSAPFVFLNEQDIELSDEEQAALKPWLEKLRQWEVYDYSEVTTIIEKIENGSGNMALWKEQLVKAVQTGNEGQFSKLISIEK